jgi:uncharacterized LabA/DUF88 family protein
VIAYIDGFNLYFGLKSQKWQRYYWLDLKLLAKNLLKRHQELIFTKYFTSRVSFPPDKCRRQSTFIEALETLTDFQIFYGKYQLNSRQCRNCGQKDQIPNEKMTDVNIAVEMLADAFQDSFDVALLVSADSDLTAPVISIKRLFPQKEIVAAFPPQRFSTELAKHVHAYFTIGRANLAKSIFPERVQKADGYVLQCPTEWK